MSPLSGVGSPLGLGDTLPQSGEEGSPPGPEPDEDEEPYVTMESPSEEDVHKDLLKVSGATGDRQEQPSQKGPADDHEPAGEMQGEECSTLLPEQNYKEPTED